MWSKLPNTEITVVDQIVAIVFNDLRYIYLIFHFILTRHAIGRRFLGLITIQPIAWRVRMKEN